MMVHEYITYANVHKFPSDRHGANRYFKLTIGKIEQFYVSLSPGFLKDSLFFFYFLLHLQVTF